MTEGRTHTGVSRFVHVGRDPPEDWLECRAESTRNLHPVTYRSRAPEREGRIQPPHSLQQIHSDCCSSLLRLHGCRVEKVGGLINSVGRAVTGISLPSVLFLQTASSNQTTISRFKIHFGDDVNDAPAICSFSFLTMISTPMA